MEDKQITILRDDPPKKAIIRLAVPSMLAMTAQLIYNLADTYFIGLTGNTLFVAAVTLAMPIFFLTQAIGSIFAVGAASYISRMLGKENYEEANRANATAFYLSIIMSGAMAIVIMLFFKPLLSVIGTSPDTYRPTWEFLIICVPFSPLMVLQVTLSGVVRAVGSARQSMLGVVIGIAVTTVLDPIFIFPLNMGVAGVAWATVIGNAVGTLYFLFYFGMGKSTLSIGFKYFKPSRQIIAETFKIGLPAAMSNIVLTFVLIVSNNIAESYGDYVVSGSGICWRVFNVSFMLIFGLALGFQPFAGFNFGAGQFDRVKAGFKYTLIYSEVLAVVFLGLYAAFGEDMVRWFINDPATVQVGAAFVWAYMWAIPFFALQVVIIVVFQSTGMAVKAMVVTLGRQLIVYLPLVFIMNRFWGLTGFIYSETAADVIITVFAVILAVPFFKGFLSRGGPQAQSEDAASVD